MQMLFESSFSFCTQQVTTRLQSGEAATAVEAQVARQSGRDASAGQKPHRNNSRRQQAAAAQNREKCAQLIEARQQQTAVMKNIALPYPGACPQG
jgi:hypothetical protein